MLAKPLDLVAESLDERKDDDVSSGVLEKLFGHYHFDADQLKVSARGCMTVFTQNLLAFA